MAVPAANMHVYKRPRHAKVGAKPVLPVDTRYTPSGIMLAKRVVISAEATTTCWQRERLSRHYHGPVQWVDLTAENLCVGVEEELCVSC